MAATRAGFRDFRLRPDWKLVAGAGFDSSSLKLS